MDLFGRNKKRGGKRLASNTHNTHDTHSFFEENSEEAWERIKESFSKPKTWILTGVGLVGVVLLGLVLSFVFSIHAPALPGFTGADGELETPAEQAGRKKGTYTFLLIGTDASSANTDTLMVVSYDVDDEKVSLLSIPRDTMVNVSWDIKKINSVYSVKGIDGLKSHIGKLVGFTPDYYVKINVHAFADVIELLGGVDFDVPRNMDYDDPAQDLHIHLKQGQQHLNGIQSMGLVRWRHNNDYTRGYSDEERMKTQQAFLKTAMQQCISLKNWNKVDDLVRMFYENVESDLTLGEMLWFAKEASAMKDFSNVNTFTMPGDYNASAWSRTYHGYQSYVLVDGTELLKIINEHFNPYQSDIRYQDLDIMRINSDGSVSSSTGSTADGKATSAPAKTGKPAQETTPAEVTEETPGETEPETGAENGQQTEETPQESETSENETSEGETSGNEQPAEQSGASEEAPQQPKTEEPAAGSETPAEENAA